MSFRKVLFFGAALVFGLAGTANAQFGLYGMYAGTEVSGVTCLDPQGLCSAANGDVKPFGAAGGVYYDFKTYGPVRLGFDLRADLLHASKSASSRTGGVGAARAHDALGGVRATFHTPVSYLRPYVQASMGWASSDVTEPNVETYDNFLQYQVFAGLDVRVFPILDVRVIELGIGGMDRVGTGLGASSLGVKSISAGIVFHLP